MFWRQSYTDGIMHVCFSMLRIRQLCIYIVASSSLCSPLSTSASSSSSRHYTADCARRHNTIMCHYLTHIRTRATLEKHAQARSRIYGSFILQLVVVQYGSEYYRCSYRTMHESPQLPTAWCLMRFYHVSNFNPLKVRNDTANGVWSCRCLRYGTRASAV